MQEHNKSSSHAVYLVRLHVVFVTKYRRPVLNDVIRTDLKLAFEEIARAWRCSVMEFGAEPDHVHLLLDVHPALNIASLLNNLKSASSKRIRKLHGTWLKQFYQKPVLWHRAYYVGSVGQVALETIRRYIAAQGEDLRRNPLA